MSVHLVTFASEDMRQSAELCAQSAERYGVKDFHIWSQGEIEHSNYADEERWRTLELMDKSTRGGGGWWGWKPYIIYDTLCQIGNGYLIYSDAGVEFIDNVNYIIDRMDQDIFLFGNQWEHAHWCKRDVIEAVFPSKNPPYMSDKKWSEFGKQVQASVIFFKVTDYSKKFVQEWLDLCLTPGLIDDSPSMTPDHPEFVEHRHDQAILTTQAYRDGLKLHWWPASYNDGAFIYERGGYPDEGYPVIVNHHRRRNADWEQAA